MTHAINSNTNLIFIDFTRTHTQMRKSPRGEKESGKEIRRQSKKRKFKEKKERRRKKLINKLKINKKDEMKI